MVELFLIFLVTLLLFDSKRIPEIARGLGQGLREFRAASRDIMNELDVSKAGSAPPARQQPTGASDRPVRVPPVTPDGAEYDEPLAPAVSAPSPPPNQTELHG